MVRFIEDHREAYETRSGLLLFPIAIFAAAFLIFLVQPLVGKRILPWFGGAPAVWTLCLAFYQTALFLGYAYAHALNRFAAPALQPWIHGIVVAAALLSLPVLPGESWKPDGASTPSLRIFAMLASNVALPFMVLAASGPLVQVWFARRYPARSPYPLYAVSNFGSLLALLAYPTWIEPRLGLSETGILWSLAFAGTVSGVLACAVISRGAGPMGVYARSDGPAPEQARPTPRRIVAWLGLSACAVIMLMAVTSALCLEVASVPFLWVLPLSTYLVTFIVCFASERTYHRAGYLMLGLAAFAAHVSPSFLSRWLDPVSLVIARSLTVQIPSLCLLLFAVCMVMHGELYRLRPASRSLTGFYLCVSGGGALGGLFVGVAAPRLFTAFLELELGLALALGLLLAACVQDPASALRSGAPRWRRAVAGSLVVAGLGLLGWRAVAVDPATVHRERSFFGVLRVVVAPMKDGGERRHLLHGSTLHGVQLLGEGLRGRPTSYYGRATAVGMMLSAREPGAGTRVGVIGLGVGTLAAYGRSGDLMRFYEIDPSVVRIARDSGWFSYLDDSPARIEVVHGDARRMMEQEQAHGAGQGFDVLVVDAFTSDAVPVHLLTREAFELYSSALAPDGLLAVHASSRHVELAKLTARMGWEVGLQSLQVFTGPAPEHQSQIAKWVLLGRDRARLRRLRRSIEQVHGALGVSPALLRITQARAVEVKHVSVWTDDYSDLFSLLSRE